MNHVDLYHTKCLRVLNAEVLLSEDKDALVNTVLRLLTPAVVKPLPNDWQGITTANKALEWLRLRLAECELQAIALRSSAEVIGFVFVYHQGDDEHHIGYLLGEAFWGRGYASEVLLGLVEYYRAGLTDCTLLAGVEAGNGASIRVLEKCGFGLNDGGAGADGTLFYRLVV
jgi:RimJ/RimL family protein N-acetyltransferase